MSDSLDLGFNWQDDETESGQPPTDPNNPCIMSYGFASDDVGSWRSRGQEADVLTQGHSFIFSFFDLSRTSDIKLSDVTIDIVPVPPTSSQSPFTSFPGSFTFQKGVTGGQSAGLNARGTGWSTPSYVLANSGTYRVTVNITVSKNGENRYWMVDPEIQVGTGGGTG